MKPEDASAWLAENPDIESIRVAICDLNGALRGKRLPVTQLEKALRGATRMPLSLAGVDVWGEDIQGGALSFKTGDRDGVCDWTGRGPLRMTWSASPTALAPLWLAYEGGEPFPGDPRRALAAVADRYAAHGLTPVVATEMEFYLVDASGDAPRPPNSPATGAPMRYDSILSIDDLGHFDAFLTDVYKACAEQGVPADAAIAEAGPGQFEINLNHIDDPLRAADDALLFKEIVRGVARKHGLAATFMAKVYGHRSGSGLHTHFSVIDREGRNVFDNGGEEGTETLRHAVGGLLKAMPESTLLFAPHMNSYRRLRPGALAPCGVAWGYENRTAAVRIPGGDHRARRIEHRVAGADANPYLSLAGILGAALEGIENRIEPPAPIEGDAYAHDLPDLALDWASAVSMFRHGGMMASIFHPVLRKMLVECKKQELRSFAAEVTNFEYSTYLEVV